MPPTRAPEAPLIFVRAASLVKGSASRVWWATASAVKMLAAASVAGRCRGSERRGGRAPAEIEHQSKGGDDRDVNGECLAPME